MANAYTVTIQPGGQHFACREDEFIIAAMQRAGCGPIRYGCWGGGCGVCKMQVVSGPFETTKRMSCTHITPAEFAAGMVLICCVQPRGDVVLREV